MGLITVNDGLIFDHGCYLSLQSAVIRTSNIWEADSTDSVVIVILLLLLSLTPKAAWVWWTGILGFGATSIRRFIEDSRTWGRQHPRYILLCTFYVYIHTLAKCVSEIAFGYDHPRLARLQVPLQAVCFVFCRQERYLIARLYRSFDLNMTALALSLNLSVWLSHFSAKLFLVIDLHLC